MTLTAVTSPPTTEVEGTLEAVKLVEVTIDPSSYESTPVPSGGCLLLESLAFDTVPSPVDAGTPCANASDCGSTSYNICDPKTQTCQPFQCDETTKQCKPGEVCVAQVAPAIVGACYVGCKPFGTSTCGAGYACVSLAADQIDGACFAVGSGAPNQSCETSVVSTGCVAGYLCTEELDPEAGKIQVCRQTCTFFGGSTNPCADAGQRCTYAGVCTPQEGDDAGIGSACTLDAMSPCGLQNETYKGICTKTGASTICRKACRLTIPTDCGGTATCHDVFGDGTVGVCQ